MSIQLLVLDVSQLAHALCIGPKAASELISTGAIPVINVGGAARVRRADVERYVAELPAVAPS